MCFDSVMVKWKQIRVCVEWIQKCAQRTYNNTNKNNDTCRANDNKNSLAKNWPELRKIVFSLFLCWCSFLQCPRSRIVSIFTKQTLKKITSSISTLIIMIKHLISRQRIHTFEYCKSAAKLRWSNVLIAPEKLRFPISLCRLTHTSKT